MERTGSSSRADWVEASPPRTARPASVKTEWWDMAINGLGAEAADSGHRRRRFGQYIYIDPKNEYVIAKTPLDGEFMLPG